MQTIDIDLSTWTGITQISAKGNIAGLKYDGTVVAAGDNSYGALNVSSWAGITQVAAYDYTVGLMANGKLVIVGANNSERHKCWRLDGYYPGGSGGGYYGGSEIQRHRGRGGI